MSPSSERESMEVDVLYVGAGPATLASCLHLMERVQDKPLGMTVQHLRVGGVETLLVPVPPLAEQRRIERLEAQD